jgi:hypothetical protein
MKRTVLIVGLVVVALPRTAAAQQMDPATYVFHLYKSILDRAPTESEVALWERNLLSGMKPEEAKGAFLGSDEFYRLHSKDARKFVAAAFVHVHRRPANFDEFKFWGDRYWAVSGNRTALCMEMIRAAPPSPITVILGVVLPAEPEAVPQPNYRLVSQAEVSTVLVSLFVSGLGPCRGQPGVAGLEEQAQSLSAALTILRSAAGSDEARVDLRVRLQHAQNELFRLRDRHRSVNASLPALSLPSLVDIVDAMDALRPLVEG